MENILILLCVSVIFCDRAYSESKIYNLIAIFYKSKVNQAEILALRNRDASEEGKMMADGKPPFKWVSNQEIMNCFFSPLPGENIVYVMSSTELWKENKPPFLGKFVHITLCIEVDSEENFVLGFSYPLEFSMHFLTSELLEINIKNKKFEHLSVVEFKDFGAERIMCMMQRV